MDEPGNSKRVVKSNQYNVNAVLKSNWGFDNTLPVSYGRCNNECVKILKDTGATIVMVRRSLVRADRISGETVNLKFADGRTLVAPKTKIYLDCPYYKGLTEAACIDELPFDVILGNIPGATCACTAETIHSDPLPVSVSNTVCSVQTRHQCKIQGKPEPSTKVTKNNIVFDLHKTSTRELIALQRRETSFVKYFDRAGREELNFPKFILSNGVLTKLSIKGKNTKNVIKQIMLPVELRKKLLGIGHDNVCAGHLGVKKTQDRILTHFFWPGSYSDIRRFCLSCIRCQKYSANKPCKVPLVKMPVIGKPFYRVAVDIIGPMPKSFRRNRFALVMIDHATKYPDAVALKNIDSNTVAEALLEMFCRVGLPAEILHDQGTQFMSSVMKRFNSLLQIKSINTTPYNPRCNGTCENFNKTLKEMLRKISSDEPQIWDRYLQPLLFAYREVPQATTGFSPFELLFGYDVRGPLFLLKEK